MRSTIRLKTPEQIQIMREGGKILAAILQALSREVKPGIQMNTINILADELCKKYDVIPVFLNYQPDWSRRPFPANLCVSVNNEVVHGIPNQDDRMFNEGDMVALDMGITYKEMIVDSAITVAAGSIDEKGKDLMNVTKQALQAGIDAACQGKKTGDIGYAIEQFVKNNARNGKPYGIPLELGGHGVGFSVHEDPYVPNFGKPGQGVVLEPGMTIAIEPQLTEGTSKLYEEKDGYTLKTADGKRSAHFEHTIAITDGEPMILTAL